MSATSRAERIRGSVLGAAIGDAMGHPTEFLTMQQITSRWGPAGVTGFELWWNGDGRRFAPFTDDTQMSEVVLRTLVSAHRDGLDLDAAMTRLAAGFIDWSVNPRGGHRAPGNACLAGCRALAAGLPWREAGAESAGGCGSVMRAWPCGLLFADDPAEAERWAVAQSALTHRAPIALAACAALATGVALVMQDRETPFVLDQMVSAAHRHDPGTAGMMAQAIRDADEGIGPNVTLDRLRGWAAHEAIAAAAYLFARHANDARAAILEGANTPGDSDSLATLAGSLVGARVGLEGLPPSWVDGVERSGELLALASEAASLASDR